MPSLASPRRAAKVLSSVVATLALVASGLVFQAGVDVPGAWAAVSKTNLILSYDFSNTASYPGSGTSITDLSGQGHTGTNSENVAYSSPNMTYTTGTNGTAYTTVAGDLNGFNNGLTVSFEGTLGDLNAWERILSVGNVSPNASGLDSGSGDGFFIARYSNTSELVMGLDIAGAYSGQCRTSGAALDTSYARWTYTLGTDKVCHVYKNGVQISVNLNGGTSSATGVTMPAMLTSLSHTYNYLGRSHWTADPDLGGGIRWIKMYKTALSASEITDDATGTVTFDANGGSGSMSAQSSTSATTLTSNAFTRTGYTFAGWNTSSAGTGSNYSNGATYSFSDEITLYAKWTLNAPTVSSAATVTGAAKVGETLTGGAASFSSGTTPTVTSKWQRSSDGSTWADIAGATITSYTLVNADVANYIRFSQTGTNATSSVTSNSASTAMVLSANSVTGGSGSANSVGSMFTVPAGSTIYNVTLTSSNLAGRFSLGTTTGLTWVEGYSTTAAYMPTSISGTGSIFSFRGTGDAINTALATLNYTSSSLQTDVLKINHAVGSSTTTDVKNYIPIYDNGALTYHYYSVENIGSWTAASTVESNLGTTTTTLSGLTSPNAWRFATPRYAVEDTRLVALATPNSAAIVMGGRAASGSGTWYWPASTQPFRQ